MKRRIDRVIALALLLVTAAACNDSEQLVDPRLCEQTYEFGNSGCYQISGQVVGSQQQPLAGIRVIAEMVRDSTGLPSGFAQGVAETNAEGKFQLRAHRMFMTVADTVTTFQVRIVAARTYAPMVAGVTAFATVTIAPVGSLAPNTVVNFVLPVP